MGHDRLADRCGATHGFGHQLLPLHPPSVVREAHDLSGQSPEIDQLPASLLSPRNGTVRQHPNDRIAADQSQLRFQMLRRIGSRIEIRHRTNGGITSVRGGSRTRRNGLFLRKNPVRAGGHAHRPIPAIHDNPSNRLPGRPPQARPDRLWQRFYRLRSPDRPFRTFRPDRTSHL